MNDLEYSFEGKVDLYDFGRMAYSIVYVPRNVLSKLPLRQYPRLRMEGEVHGRPFHGALQPAGSGKYYLLLSKRFLKSSGLSVGSRVLIQLRIADQDAVDVPDELRFALRANSNAERTWDQLTPGKKRSLAHRVGSAKRAETRESRVEEIIEALGEGRDAL